MQCIALDKIRVGKSAAHTDKTSRETAEQARIQYGGKGMNLGQLRQHGFDVPAGFVIPTPVFEFVVNEALKSHPGEHPQKVLEHLEFSVEFVDAVREAMQQVGASRWAVRSSSTDEDSQTHSFAGLQQSIIGVQSLDECIEAIRSVWMSFYARERLLYPTQASLMAPVPAMAVIVQAFIDSDVAGVVFTSHPIEGDGTILINVSKGQGANVVDGKAAESLCVAKSTGRSGSKSEFLTKAQIKELSAIACRIEAAFQKPQDIEFAFENGRLWILQARDIVPASHNAARTLYSNVNVGEALSGVCTPMTWSVGMSIASKGFETVFAMLGLRIPENYSFITTFNGHIYLNISEFMSVASQIPFVDPDIFGKIAGIQSLREYACAIEPMGKAHFIRNLPHCLAELFRIQSRMRHLNERATAFEAKRDELLMIDLSEAGMPTIQNAFSRLNDVFFDCAFDMLSAGGAFMAHYVMFSNFVGHVAEEETRELEQYLVTGLPGIASAAPGLELLNIANEIRKNPELARAFIDETSFDDIDGFQQTISRLPGAATFEAHLRNFLTSYGARASQEAELANPRWREDPRFLFRVIRTHLKTGITNDPKHLVDAISDNREAQSNEFKSMLSRSLRPIFRALRDSSRKFAFLREQWRSYVVDVLGIFRKYLLEVASQFVADRILDDPNDVFFLTYDEILDGIAHHEKLDRARLAIAFRKARHEAYQSARSLPGTFVSHPNQCEDSNDNPCGEVLYGLPASPGCVEARVRIIHSIDEASELEYGEILVTSSTDVAWTPLFLVASAILTELGGPLSHAFVVAREYGVPAVVSIPGLLDTLKTGDIVRISGEKGTVVLVESARDHLNTAKPI